MRRIALIAGLLALGPPAAAADAAAVRWTVWADCAAAYQANARLSDPDRAAAMATQVSDVASDYVKAAARAYRRQAGPGGAQSARPVTERIARRTARFISRPRTEVERVIDACPQLED
jgi:hypothetical protein